MRSFLSYNKRQKKSLMKTSVNNFFMRKNLSSFLTLLVIVFGSGIVRAQIISGDLFLRGKYLEAGAQMNGALGTKGTAPTGYNPHPGSAISCTGSSGSGQLASVYDYGLDGWTTGTPAYMGDYTIPGTPWEMWAIQANGSCARVYSVGCSITGSGSLAGSFTSYTPGPGTVAGTWNGTYLSGSLTVVDEYRVDTLGSALIFTVKMYNNTSSSINNVYFWRSSDPDNDQSWSGSFSTNNYINYQGTSSSDIRHMVSAYTTATHGSGHTPYSLGARDCRAKVVIYNNWGGFACTTLDGIYAGGSAATCLGGSYYDLRTVHSGDIGIGIVFNLGNIPAYDSVGFSFAYIFNDSVGLMQAFPDPQMSLLGHITDTAYTIGCSGVTDSVVPVDILHGDTRQWTMGNWVWSPATGLSSSTGVHNTVHLNGITGVQHYTITGTDSAGGNCESKTFYLTVIPPPHIEATNSGPVCEGDRVTLYIHDTGSAVGSTYSWVDNRGRTIGTSTTITITTTAADSGYFYALKTSGYCTAIDSTLVVVHARPTAPGTTPLSYCQYEPTAPLTAVGVNLLWYANATGGSGSTSAPVPSSNVPGTYTWYVSSTSAFGCEGPRAPIVVTIKPKPGQPDPYSPTYCQFDISVPLTATGTALLWSGPGISSTSIAPTPPTTMPGIQTYYVTQTINGCTSDSIALYVTVNPKPTPPTVRDTAYCQYEHSVPLTASAISAVKWYASSTSVTPLSGAPTPSTTVVGNTSWWVTQTALGCESDKAQVTVTTYKLPNFDILAGKPFVCQYDTLSLSYNPFDNAPYPGYKWYLPNGAHIVRGTDTDSSITVEFDSLYFQKVILLTSDYNGRCKVYDTLPVKVVYTPEAVAFTSNHQDLCVNDTIVVALATRSDNAYNYHWNFAGGTIVSHSSNTGGPYKITWSTPGTHIINVATATVEGCISKPTTDTFTVHELPDARILPFPAGICSEDSINLEAYDSTHSAFKYEWAPKHYFYTSQNEHHAWGRIQNQGYIYLTVTTPYNCVSRDSLLLQPDGCCKLYMPTAFVPGATDERLKRFKPLFKDGSYHRFHDFRIVNRWGQTVFQSKDSDEGWDGTFGGEPQDVGVYYYYVTYDCNDFKGGEAGGGTNLIQKGEITLVR